MHLATPPQGVRYRGPITDTSRWQNFKHRNDDIFVCTPPKCGTTWTQAICAMLIAETPDHGTQPGVVSPWIDAAFAPIEDYLRQVEAQTHRRYIKTHTPLDGIPYYPSCTYLAVFRDPRDVYFSAINHRDNMSDQALALAVFPNGANAFEDWLYKTGEPGTWDLVSLASLVHFFKTYWHYRELPNVHLFHYADMKRDLRSAIAAMATACDIAVDAQQLDGYAKAATFERIKQRAEQFAPMSGSGIWKAEPGFFANGRNLQWQDRLSAAQLAAFDDRLAQLLPPAEAAWLLNGNLSDRPKPGL
jgi:aryl sulfotransferase